jgi:hypothetical protein
MLGAEEDHQVAPRKAVEHVRAAGHAGGHDAEQDAARRYVSRMSTSCTCSGLRSSLETKAEPATPGNQLGPTKPGRARPSGSVAGTLVAVKRRWYETGGAFTMTRSVPSSGVLRHLFDAISPPRD